MKIEIPAIPFGEIKPQLDTKDEEFDYPIRVDDDYSILVFQLLRYDYETEVFTIDDTIMAASEAFDITIDASLQYPLDHVRSQLIQPDATVDMFYDTINHLYIYLTPRTVERQPNLSAALSFADDRINVDGSENKNLAIVELT